MRLKSTQQVYAYYQELKGDRLAPMRSDIDPSKLKSVLPDLFMLSLDDDGMFRFRLAGTRVCTVLGQEMRGFPFETVLEPRASHRTLLAAGALLANKSPVICAVTATDSAGETMELELAMMPLYSNEGICDRIFASLVPVGGQAPFDQLPRLIEPGAIEFLGNDAPATPDLSTTSGQVGALLSRSMQLRLFSGGKSG